MNTKARTRVTEIFVMILIVAIFISSFIFKNQLESLVTREVVGYGLIMIGALSFLFEFIPQYITPHLLIIEASLLGFPLGRTMIVVVASSVLGSALGFEVGKKYGKNIIKKIYSKKEYSALEKKVRKHEKWVLPIAAVSPVPYIPMIFGSLGVLRKDFWTFGILIRVLGFAAFSILFFL